ncbi:MAG: type II toxin-antitoxin system PemK/MazF family toxin [Gleimia sp.]
MPKGSPLPEFSYSPERNHRADPGEVVWTWVPFEEDPTQGKDRPVLVLAETNRGVIASQMTSRDRTEDFLSEDKFGRAWLDIGTGSWDQQGRNSEVRLDRLLVIPRGSIRREGGRLDKDTFYHVVRRIREVHEAHGWGEH